MPKETCQFLREVTRDEESPTKRVNEVQVGGVAFGPGATLSILSLSPFFFVAVEGFWETRYSLGHSDHKS